MSVSLVLVAQPARSCTPRTLGIERHSSTASSGYGSCRGRPLAPFNVKPEKFDLRLRLRGPRRGSQLTADPARFLVASPSGASSTSPSGPLARAAVDGWHSLESWPVCRPHVPPATRELGTRRALAASRRARSFRVLLWPVSVRSFDPWQPT